MGRKAISSDPNGDNFPWPPPAVGDLSSPDGIDDTPAICVFMDSASTEEQKQMLAELELVSRKIIDASKSKNEDPKYLFFAAQSTRGAVCQIRTICGLPSDAQQVTMILLDIGDNGAYYTSDSSDVSVSSVESFIRSFE